MAITDWPEERRPREKLLKRGATSLTDSELLAIFLRTGVHGLSAVDLADRLIGQFGSVSSLLNASQAEFVQGYGLGDAKFAQLQAVMELSSRNFSEKLQRVDVLSDTTSVKRYLSAQIKSREREFFYVLFLDSQNRLIVGETLFAGTLGSASVYPREVLKRVLSLNSSAVILAHNHPSGVTEPSRSDIHITEQLSKALGLIDVKLLDHMIVGDDDVLSFAEKGLI